jgi:hypothetical protein
MLELKPGGTGGRAGSGGCFHMSFRSGSRASGACAGAAYDYVTRTDEYADRELDEALYTESGNMPSWAEEEPAEFWEAADLYERANGRLYVNADFTLPLGLDRGEQVALAREFVDDLTGDERLPYTMAIHAGLDADGVEHNPHVHLMFSERQNDGIERSPKEWFRRANASHSERAAHRRAEHSTVRPGSRRRERTGRT